MRFDSKNSLMRLTWEETAAVNMSPFLPLQNNVFKAFLRAGKRRVLFFWATCLSPWQGNTFTRVLTQQEATRSTASLGTSWVICIVLSAIHINWTVLGLKWSSLGICDWGCSTSIPWHFTEIDPFGTALLSTAVTQGHLCLPGPSILAPPVCSFIGKQLFC